MVRREGLGQRGNSRRPLAAVHLTTRKSDGSITCSSRAWISIRVTFYRLNTDFHAVDSVPKPCDRAGVGIQDGFAGAAEFSAGRDLFRFTNPVSEIHGLQSDPLIPCCVLLICCCRPRTGNGIQHDSDQKKVLRTADLISQIYVDHSGDRKSVEAAVQGLTPRTITADYRIDTVIRSDMTVVSLNASTKEKGSEHESAEHKPSAILW